MATELENHQREQETMTRSKVYYNQSVKNNKNSNIIDVTRKSASRNFTKLRKRISIFSSSSSSSSSSSLSSSSSSLPSPVSSTSTFTASTKNSIADFYEPEFLLASNQNGEENNMLKTPFQVLNNHNNNKTSNNNSMKIKDNKKHKGIFIMRSKGNNDIRYEKDFTIFAQENLYRQEILRNEDEYDNNNNMANAVGGGEYNGKYYYYDDNYVDTATNQYNKRNSIQSIKLAVKQFAGVGKERKRNNEAYHQDGKTNPFE